MRNTRGFKISPPSWYYFVRWQWESDKRKKICEIYVTHRWKLISKYFKMLICRLIKSIYIALAQLYQFIENITVGTNMVVLLVAGELSLVAMSQIAYNWSLLYCCRSCNAEWLPIGWFTTSVDLVITQVWHTNKSPINNIRAAWNITGSKNGYKRLYSLSTKHASHA